MEKLAEVLVDIDDVQVMQQFLGEILTPKEMRDLDLRWQLLLELNRGNTQRSIANKYGISLCKITRGSKILKKQNGVIVKLLKPSRRKESRK